MKLTDSMKDYEPLIIPLEKPIEELTSKEAEIYFRWYTQNINSRVNYLIEKVSSTYRISKQKLYFTEEALVFIWRWVLQRAEISKTPKKVLREIKRNMEGQPRSMINHIIEQNKEELSVYTRYILRDVGMYLGEMLVAKFPAIQWSYKTAPKNYVYVNEPLLIGFIDDNPDYPKTFYPDFEPISAVECLATNLFDKTQNENDLLNLYNSMLPLIPANEDRKRDGPMS